MTVRRTPRRASSTENRPHERLEHPIGRAGELRQVAPMDVELHARKGLVS